jgi:hypothetical protein
MSAHIFSQRVPSLDGTTAWLNSPPLSAEGLRGRVALFDVCTFSCVNWLRTLPYVRAWWNAYKGDGFVVVGIHSPEFSFEHDAGAVDDALKKRGVDYPIAIDNDFALWRAFDNNYWPALYLADAAGQIRHRHFGEGAYEETERAIQELLDVERPLVSVEPQGDEVSADWAAVRSPETYVGDARGERRVEGRPLRLNEWTLAGAWTTGLEAAVLDEAGGRIAYRFAARDVNLVMGPREHGATVRFRVTVDGEPPGNAHGLDVDADGNGVAPEQRMYQLVRQPRPAAERTFEIEFAGSGVAAYVFTFG